MQPRIVLSLITVLASSMALAAEGNPTFARREAARVADPDYGSYGNANGHGNCCHEHIDRQCCHKPDSFKIDCYRPVYYKPDFYKPDCDKPDCYRYKSHCCDYDFNDCDRCGDRCGGYREHPDSLIEMNIAGIEKH